MPITDKGSASFKPRARILKILGEQLITNEVIALVELVKNSYDADATEVEVVLENITDVENGKISIKDNGVGMSLDTVLTAWLEPGTDYRKRQREKGERSKIFHRPILGEKGVGRFAAQKLGSLITLTTRTNNDDKETIVEVNWKDFEKDKFLSEVKVDWIRIKPKIFRNSTGTLLEINFIHKSWTKSMILKVAQKLKSLQSPFEEIRNFNIKFICEDYQKIIDNIVPIKDLLEKAVYTMKGYISDKGEMNASYSFYNPAFSQLKREFIFNNEEIRDIVYFSIEKGLRYPICGGFEFQFYAWDLDPQTMKETVTRKIYDDFIKPHTGIRIYRDKFRVWPYGEEGNDWLELDARRVNNMRKCFSNNQIIGLIEISASINVELIDKTDREGLILNKEYEDFKSMVLSSINQFEIERRKDKNIVDNLREKGKRLDDTLTAINDLRNKMEKEDIYNTYKSLINRIEIAYNTEVTNTLEPLIVSAGIGIAYQMPAHEILIQIEGMKDILTNFEKDLKFLDIGGTVAGNVPKLYSLAENIGDIADGALELSKRKPIIFSLKSVVDFCLYIKNPELKRDEIDIVIDEQDKINIKGYQNLVMTSILNLLDNSIYWLKKVENKKIKITIRRNEENKPQIIVSDSGPGLNRSDLPYLGEAYYTRKPDGTGLGLFISKRAMQRNNGSVIFDFYPNDPSYLSGSNIVLEFESGAEVKE